MKEYLILKISYQVGNIMASNTVEKQKDKIITELSVQKDKIHNALASLKESVLEIEEGSDNTPYWNGNNAYTSISELLTNIDLSYAILDYVDEWQKELKKFH